MLKPQWYRTALTLLTISVLVACNPNEQDNEQFPPVQWEDIDITDTDRQMEPQPGQTEFISADGRNGQASQPAPDRGNNDDYNGNNASDNNATEESGAPDGDAGSDDPRTAEEGDIYRVVAESDLLLNLNSYRGLQVIDLSDTASPQIIGRAKVSGTPVEMYQVGNIVYVLMNNWRGYYGSRDDIEINAYEGGVVLAIDISEPSSPTLLTQAEVPGNIRTSRLTRGNGSEALFVAASNNNSTYVKSFTVSDDGDLSTQTELELGGWVTDIQATGERLLVARQNWQEHNNRSQVAVIDISNPTGEMIEGESVLVKGRVQTQFNMSMHGDMLRVVSGGGWDSNTNYFETFDASDIQNITPLDSATFGDNEDLYATLFLDNSAFFVTYRRVDPFHAFDIQEDGTVTEMSEYIISGWNDYFRAVSNQSRLIGIGKNDENSRNTMAVSLYDITDLSNPDPFIARAEIELDYSWSEAQWDHRAFSVLENATNATGPNGEEETGLVLLPYSGWNSDEDRYISAVQIFTFSDSSLTLRGTMEHGTQVRRSFMAGHDAHTTANISEAELSLYDIENPDQPSETGRLALAPNYSDFWVFGDYGVRRHSMASYYRWWGYYGNEQNQFDYLEVVALNEHPDETHAIAAIEIPANAQIFRNGNHLVSVHIIAQSYDRDEGPEAEIQVWNFANANEPELKATLTSSHILGGRNYDYYDDYYYDDPWGGYYGAQFNAVALDDALVFNAQISQRELVGTEHYENIYPTNEINSRGCYDDDGRQECSYYTGGIYCTYTERTDGTTTPRTCSGEIRYCISNAQGNTECEPVNPSEVSVETYSRSYERYRHWFSYDLQALDLTGDEIALTDVISLPSSDEAVSLFGKGNSLYYGYKKPYTLQNDPRSYVRYFFKEIDFRQPSSPDIGSAINIPGELIAVDGNKIYTKDFLWGENIVETAIAKLTRSSNVATLDAVHRFVDHEVHNVAVDESGNLLVSHQLSWRVNNEDDNNVAGGVAVDSDAPMNNYGGYYDYNPRKQKLSILDVSGNALSLLTETEIDTWATLRSVKVGRAIFTVPGGILVLNLDNPRSPYAQAYFPTMGWTQNLTVHGSDMYYAAGPYGLYRFDIDEFNLVTP